MVTELRLSRVALDRETGNIMLLKDLAVWQPEFKHKIPSTITSKIAITLQLRSSHAGGI